MSNLHALLMVLESAEKERDEALRALDAGRQAHDAAQRQAQSLQDWRKDYELRWQSQFSRQSGGMEILRCYQDFMARLSDAVRDQGTRVELAQVQMNRLQRQLIECERRVAAVANLIERREVEHNLRQQRQEQKATDEMAARTVRGRPSMGSNPMSPVDSLGF